MSAKLRESCPGLGRDAAEKGADAGEQCLGAEGLGDVIVGAGVEAAHHVLILGAGGEHDDRQGARFGAAPDLTADLDAGERRQHPVQQHKIGLGFGDADQRLVPVGCFVHGVTGFLQVIAQQGEKRGFVFHHEDGRFGAVHGEASRARTAA